MSEKIKVQHLQRKAILYVRQSSPHQVARNEESRRLQYAMESRLRNLGWSEVMVVDEDLGKSASGSATRVGFERMVADVCLGQVGAVAAREVSRFARNSRDWQHLIEVCRMVDTLLVDQEMVYDPRRGNDRLLLGLKGSLNEYELDILRLRSLEARREKARRGELSTLVAVGYATEGDGQLVKEPDLRVQEALGLVFRKFLEFGTVRQTLLWFHEQEIDLPLRRHDGHGWNIGWKRPSYGTILRILRNPVYAGVYAYGRRNSEVSYEQGVARKRLHWRPVGEWLALHYDHHEAYIDRRQFERIQEMISKNGREWQEPGSGAPKKGIALLSSLLRCGRCGRKLTVRYTGRQHDVQRYVCCRGKLDNAEPLCISFGGQPVDEAVSREILRVVQPGAIEAARLTAQDVVCQLDEVGNALELALREARYAAERARRQFDAVDPENRLVLDELERRWNNALEKAAELEGRLAEHKARREATKPPSTEVLRDLAGDFGRVWHHPGADIRLKKRIARTLIEEIVVDVDRTVGQVSLVIHWKGGIHTTVDVRCRRRGQNQLHASPEATEAVAVLVRICTDNVIAAVLNRNGLTTGHGNRWSRERVLSLRSHRNIPVHSRERQEAEGWMNLKQAAAYLGVGPKTVRRAVERGLIAGLHPLPDGPWILKREDLDAPRARTIGHHAERGRRCPAGQDRDDISLFRPTNCSDGAL